MCMCLQESAKGRGYQMSWSWNYPGGKSSDRVLAAKVRSSARAASAHNHPVSPPSDLFGFSSFSVPFYSFLMHFLQMIQLIQFCILLSFVYTDFLS